tara:strand:+ start:534 stop:1292 length:759 start_codon:yes stop_codon:yes gene_type:complete
MLENSNEKQVAVKQEAGLPSDALFEADAKLGFENVDQESLALPILKLLQNGSGEAQKRNPNYVEGAEPGMFFNTVTRKLYDGEKGIQVIPCHYRLEYQEWADFGTGSGRPENIYPASSDILSKTTKDAMGKDRLPNGNYIQKTSQHFVIITDGKSAETALISMYSSQAKVSRKWNSMMMSITKNGKDGPYTPPPFSHYYKISSVENTGKGNQWYGYNIVKVGEVSDANVYKRAKTFYESCRRGDSSVNGSGK